MFAGASQNKSASFSVATAIRVMVSFRGQIGLMLRPKLICTAPRTCPQFYSLSDITAPNVRTSKKFWHIQARAFSISSGFFFLSSISSA